MSVLMTAWPVAQYSAVVKCDKRLTAAMNWPWHSCTHPPPLWKALWETGSVWSAVNVSFRELYKYGDPGTRPLRSTDRILCVLLENKTDATQRFFSVVNFCWDDHCSHWGFVPYMAVQHALSFTPTFAPLLLAFSARGRHHADIFHYHVTQGVPDMHHPQLLPSELAAWNNFALPRTLRSAYHIQHGTECDWTRCRLNSRTHIMKKKVLDYVFVKGDNVTCESTEIPSELGADEPSEHVMLTFLVHYANDTDNMDNAS